MLSVWIVSIVSWTDVCTGFCAKMSNAELTDNTSAAVLMSWMKYCRKRCPFLYSHFSFYLSQVVSLPFLLFLLLRLRPYPLSLFITLCADSVAFLRTISRILVLGSVFQAMSVIMFRPVTNASEPIALALCDSKGRRNERHSLPRISWFHDRAVGKADYCI